MVAVPEHCWDYNHCVCQNPTTLGREEKRFRRARDIHKWDSRVKAIDFEDTRDSVFDNIEASSYHGPIIMLTIVYLSLTNLSGQ